MIRIKLAELCGKHKKKVSDVAEGSGVNKNTLYKLYHEKSGRVDLAVLEAICIYFQCDLDNLMEFDPSYIRPSAGV